MTVSTLFYDKVYGRLYFVLRLCSFPNNNNNNNLFLAHMT